MGALAQADQVIPLNVKNVLDHLIIVFPDGDAVQFYIGQFSRIAPVLYNCHSVEPTGIPKIIGVVHVFKNGAIHRARAVDPRDPENIVSRGDPVKGRNFQIHFRGLSQRQFHLVVQASRLTAYRHRSPGIFG